MSAQKLGGYVHTRMSIGRVTFVGSDWLYCCYGTEWAEQAPDAIQTFIASSHGISVYSATKLGGQCNRPVARYIRSPLSMNLAIHSCWSLVAVAFPCTQLHMYLPCIGRWCNLICWYMLVTVVIMLAKGYL